jgi:hypothetical protein
MIRSKTLITPKAEAAQPITPEIANIIGQAIIEAGRNSDKLTLSIANALQMLLPQPVVQPVIVQPVIEKAVASTAPPEEIASNEPPALVVPAPSSWVFKIARDSDGDITAIKAKSPTSFWNFDIDRNADGSMTKINATSPDSSWEFKVIRDSDGNMASIKAITT